LVKEFHASNLSQAAFCCRHAVPLSTFQWYLKQHRDDEDATGKVCAGLVAVEVVSPMLQGAEKALAVVLPRGRRIEVGMGFDASTLARIVAVLERMERCSEWVLPRASIWRWDSPRCARAPTVSMVWCVIS
jgi:hypothetical protein